uniref:Uncharacterized protein n=1 Tax=Mola mola TaxID=94237 RepID=A0A3Q3X5C6_MOLML
MKSHATSISGDYSNIGSRMKAKYKIGGSKMKSFKIKVKIISPEFHPVFSSLLKLYRANCVSFLSAIVADAVVRNVYYKYFHPKEALVSNGALNREFSRAAGKVVTEIFDENVGNNFLCFVSLFTALTFVYPHGATLSVVKPAVAVLSPASVCFPLKRPVLAFHQGKETGKLAVLGSCHMFSDQYLDKEENSKIMDVVLQWLMTDDIQLNPIDAEDPEVRENTYYTMLPDTGCLLEHLRVCLQDGVENLRDFTSLFDISLFNFSTDTLPQVISAYKLLNVKDEPLQLITPQFETPLPQLQPAVFPPALSDCPPPMLDLVDLDEAFSSEKVCLAQLTTKCIDDLESYVRKCEILGVMPKLDKDQMDAKHILEHIFFQVVEFKKDRYNSFVSMCH